MPDQLLLKWHFAYLFIYFTFIYLFTKNSFELRDDLRPALCCDGLLPFATVAARVLGGDEFVRAQAI